VLVKPLQVLLVASLLTSTTLLHAGLITYNSRSAFDAQGTIVYNTNFDSYPVGVLTPAGTPFTVGGVTYTATQNYIAGQSTPGYNNVRAVFFPFNSPPPVRVDATIETYPSHDMLGFLLGALDASFPYIDITVYTNTGSYFLPVQPVPTVDTALQFFGFVATGGEYLTEFTLQAGQNPGSTPAITDIEIGNTSAVINPVPEPATLALLSTGIVGVMGALRKRLRG
jgi:PEP-CTERM motif